MYDVVQWSIGDSVEGGPILQVMQSINTLRGEWSEPHIWEETGQRLDGVQVVLPELAIEAGMVAGYLSAQGGGRGGFEGVEWKDGRGTKRWLVDMLDCGRELFSIGSGCVMSNVD